MYNKATEKLLKAETQRKLNSMCLWCSNWQNSDYKLACVLHSNNKHVYYATIDTVGLLKNNVHEHFAFTN